MSKLQGVIFVIVALVLVGLTAAVIVGMEAAEKLREWIEGIRS